MAMRSQTKEKAAATKLEIMQKFEKLRKRGIKQEDLKVLGFDDLTEKYQSIPDLNIDKSPDHQSSIGRAADLTKSIDAS